MQSWLLRFWEDVVLVVERIFQIPSALQAVIDMLHAAIIELCERLEVCELDIIWLIIRTQLEGDWKVGSVGLHGDVVCRFEVELVLTRQPHILAVVRMRGQYLFVRVLVD